MSRNTKGVQIKQIAEHLGLSSGTVSIVLNGRGDELRISRETQKMVLNTAREMNYQSGKTQKKKEDGKNNTSFVSGGLGYSGICNI